MEIGRDFRKAFRRRRRADSTSTRPTEMENTQKVSVIQQPVFSNTGTLEDVHRTRKWKLTDMSVKFSNSNGSFAYNGGYFVHQSSDTLMKSGITTNILTNRQCYNDYSFEELREQFYHMIFDNSFAISPEILHLADFIKEVKSRGYPLLVSDNNLEDTVHNMQKMEVQEKTYFEDIVKPNPKHFTQVDFLPTSQSFHLTNQLLLLKKRCLANLGMYLEAVTTQLSKKMEKICHGVKCKKMATNQRLPNEVFVDVKQDQESEEKPMLGEANINNDHSTYTCLHCSLLMNLDKTLEKLKECLDVSLDICKKKENVLKYFCDDVASRNVSFGKSYREASLDELRSAVLVSGQILRMQSFYGSHVNQIHVLLTSLAISTKNLQRLGISTVSNTPLSTLTLEKTSEQVESEEEDVENIKSAVKDEKFDDNFTGDCQLSNDFQPREGVAGLRQFLDVFVKSIKILQPLEKSIIQVTCHVMEKEDVNDQKSLDIINEGGLLPPFSKEDVVLKYYRSPFEEPAVLAQTSDTLCNYALFRKIVLPNGEGRLTGIDGRFLYEGEWKKGKRDGYGEAFLLCEKHQSWSNIGEYSGNWKSNARHGFGHMVFSDGSVYDGEWYFDQIHGHGVLKRFDGCILKGFWFQGNPNGCVSFTWPHGVTEYREYKTGCILRVCDPQHDLPSQLNTLKSIESEREEKLYYKNCLKDFRGKLDKVKEECEEKTRELISKEQKEKLEVVSSLQHARELQTKETEKNRELQKKVDCLICMKRPKNCILLPCTHFNYCYQCIKLLAQKKCPTCKQVISGEIRCKLS